MGRPNKKPARRVEIKKAHRMRVGYTCAMHISDFMLWKAIAFLVVVAIYRFLVGFSGKD
jgi:hypothetical protein